MCELRTSLIEITPEVVFEKKRCFCYMVGGGSFFPLLPMVRAHVGSISSEQVELGRWEWSHLKALEVQDTCG